MSLDTLLTVLFLIVFIGLPLLSRVVRGRSRKPPGTTRPGEPPTTAGPPSAEGADVPPWLAEAQRRVREARAAEAGSTGRTPEAQRPGGVGAAPERSSPSGERPLVPQDASHPMAPPAQRGLVPSDPFRPQAAPKEAPLVPQDASHPMAPPPQPDMVPSDPFRPQAVPKEGPLVPQEPFERGLARPAPQQTGAGGARKAGPPATAVGSGPTVVVAEVEEVGVSAPKGQGRAPAGETEYAVVEVLLEARRARRRARMRRQGPRPSARLGVVDLLRFDREAIVSGLIWHEILDEPAWKRQRRRGLSRPRSR